MMPAASRFDGMRHDWASAAFFDIHFAVCSIWIIYYSIIITEPPLSFSSHIVEEAFFHFRFDSARRLPPYGAYIYFLNNSLYFHMNAWCHSTIWFPSPLPSRSRWYTSATSPWYRLSLASWKLMLHFILFWVFFDWGLFYIGAFLSFLDILYFH